MKFPKLVHFSKEGHIQLNYTNNLSTIYKPNGLWYAYKNTWLNFISEEMGIKPETKGYIYSIEIKDDTYTYNIVKKSDKGKGLYYNKILKLNKENLARFISKYHILDKDGRSILINWKMVAIDYGGVETIPYIFNDIEYSHKKIANVIIKYIRKKNNLDEDKYIPIYGMAVFDVPCGCIWNTSLIERVKYIKKN
jgi:hypothetical protein